MKQVQIYTTKYCGFCNSAKKLLNNIGVEFEEIPVDNDTALRQKVSESVGGYSTVPMIFIDGQFIGGFTELASLHQQNKL